MQRMSHAPSLEARLADYCTPPLHGAEGCVADCGQHAGDAWGEASVLGVTGIIRHGDRTALVPAAALKVDDMHWDCAWQVEDVQAAEEGGGAEHVPRLPNISRYSVTETPALRPFVNMQAAKPNTTDSAQAGRVGQSTRGAVHALVAGRVNASLACGLGTLTRKGALMLADLGRSLGRKYQAHTAALALDRGDITVTSTNFSRTALSGIAFWHGFSGPAQGQRSVGTSHKATDITLLAKRPSMCPAVHAWHATNRAHLRAFENYQAHLTGDLWQVAGCNEPWAGETFRTDPPTHWSTDTAEPVTRADCPLLQHDATGLADVALTRLCHDQPAPCTAGEGGACMSDDVVLKLVHQADADYVRWYSGRTNEVLMWPLAQHLLTTLLDMQGGGWSGAKVALRFVHDVVVYPLAAALGVVEHPQQGHDLRWPGYASRLLLELVRYANLPSQRFIRVLYQGKDVTHRIQACASTGMPACPLSTFQQHVDSLLGPHGTWEEVCHADALA